MLFSLGASNFEKPTEVIRIVEKINTFKNRIKNISLLSFERWMFNSVNNHR